MNALTLELASHRHRVLFSFRFQLHIPDKAVHPEQEIRDLPPPPRPRLKF